MNIPITSLVKPVATQAFGMGMPIVTRCLLHVFCRYSSTSTAPPTFIPHQISPAEACERFADADRNRLFAPTPQQTSALSPHVNSIKKVLLPFFRITAEIQRTVYKGNYTFRRVESDRDQNGNPYSYLYSNRFPICSSLGPQTYLDLKPIYAGNSWDSDTVESAIEEFSAHQFQPFDPQSIDKDILVDPFRKSTAIGHKQADDIIRAYECSRAKRDVVNRHGASDVSIGEITPQYKTFKISSHLFPAYILAYPNCPPRVMSALNQKTLIKGKAPLSISKCMAATTLATSAASLLFPQIAIPARAGMIVLSSVISALWAKHRLFVEYSIQQKKLAQNNEFYKSLNETFMDETQRVITEGIFDPSTLPALKVDLIHYKNLGLDPQAPVTKQMVRDAFNQKIKTVHSDYHGSDDKTRQVLNSRAAFLNAFDK